jgi:lycopene beta-cyclase
VAELDVAVVGDGPAGAALARACHDLGLRVALVGPGERWGSTYGVWTDDVADLPADVWATVSDRVVVHGTRRHEPARPYGILDADRLVAHLCDGVERVAARATSIQRFAGGQRVLTDAGAVDAAVVVDAAGRGRPLAGGRAVEPVAWQVALGVFLDEIPEHLEPGSTTLMDFRASGAGDGPPRFAYVVPTGHGVLVEETVLATRRPFAPADLAPALAARLGRHGNELMARAAGREEVVIPMGGPIPRRGEQPRFGAAAGYVHPATGYSVGASLRAAPRVAAAIAAGGDVGDAVWPAESRRTRRLHQFGLDVVLGLDRAGLAGFFDAFFDLPVERWRDYLRIDASPAGVAAVMTEVFRSSPWPVRRRLLRGDPRRLLR